MDELLYGSASHLPLRTSELIHWLAYDQMVREEQERQDRAAR